MKRNLLIMFLLVILSFSVIYNFILIIELRNIKERDRFILLRDIKHLENVIQDRSEIYSKYSKEIGNFMVYELALSQNYELLYQIALRLHDKYQHSLSNMNIIEGGEGFTFEFINDSNNNLSPKEASDLSKLYTDLASETSIFIRKEDMNQVNEQELKSLLKS